DHRLHPHLATQPERNRGRRARRPESFAGAAPGAGHARIGCDTAGAGKNGRGNTAATNPAGRRKEMSAARIDSLEAAGVAAVERIRRRSLMVAVIAGMASIVGAFLSPDHFFRSYLLAYMFWLGLTLGCLAVLMLQHLTGGAWALVIRR